MTGTLALSVSDETLLLHPERAAIWPRLGALIVADTHFGKSAALGRQGLAVPAGSDEQDLGRLTRLIRCFDIRRLIILGDFLHEPIEPDVAEAVALESWCAERRHEGVAIQVIAGNHDRGISSGWRGGLEWVAEALLEPPFRFVHDAARAPASDAFSLSGHIHPVTALRGLKRAARVPAFWLRKANLVLPSFGSFTGGQRVAAAAGERIFAVSPDLVVAFPLAK